MSITFIKQEVSIKDTASGQSTAVEQSIQQELDPIAPNAGDTPANIAIADSQDSTHFFEFEKQLHEHYAHINNSYLGTVIAMITAVVGIFSAFGFAFINTTCEFASEFGKLAVIENCQSTIYHLDVFLLIASATLLTLTCLFAVSTYIGVSRRIEQFIAHAILIKHCQANKSDYTDVIPQKYCPMGKHCIFKICHSIYGIIGRIFLYSELIVIVMTLFKGFSHSNQPSACSNWIIALTIFSFLASVAIVIWTIFDNKRKYMEKCSYYSPFYHTHCPYYSNSCKNCDNC